MIVLTFPEDKLVLTAANSGDRVSYYIKIVTPNLHYTLYMFIKITLPLFFFGGGDGEGVLDLIGFGMCDHVH